MSPHHRTFALIACAAIVVSCRDSDHRIPASPATDIRFVADDANARRLAEELSYRHLRETQPSLLKGVVGQGIGKGNGTGAGTGVGDIWTRRVHIDHLHEAHTRLIQTVDNIPVFGAEAIVHLNDDGSFKLFTDDFLRDLRVDTVPDLTEFGAMDLAVAWVGDWDTVTGTPQVDLQILRHQGSDHLAYRVQILQLQPDMTPAMPVLFIDAKSGALIWRYDNLQTIDLADEDRETHDMNHGEVSNRLIDFASAVIADSDDTVASDAHDHAGLVLDYFSTAHGRDSYDNAGAVIQSYVHANTNWNNAARAGDFFFYGDGDGVRFKPLVALDIVAHEITHAVTAHTAGLIYYGESGALNEATSDIFAAAVEAAQTGATASDIWWLADDCYLEGDAIRFMDDPERAHHYDYYPTRYTGTYDNGGVHWNSGIANLFFYLLVEGGTHPRGKTTIEVTGIGMSDAVDIWYRALTTYMTASTTFLEARGHTVQAASDLFGADSQQVMQVNNAWEAVGVKPPYDYRDIDVRPHLAGGFMSEKRFGPYNASYYEAMKFTLSGASFGTTLAVNRDRAPVYHPEDFYLEADCTEVVGFFATDTACTIDAPAPGDYYVLVAGVIGSYSGATLTVSGAGAADIRTVALKTHHNTYVTAAGPSNSDSASEGYVDADSTTIGLAQTLELIELNGGSFLLQSASGHLICPDDGGGGDVHATSRALSDDCLLSAVERPNGKMAFMTQSGHYLCAESNGQLVADRDRLGTWEEFELTTIESTTTTIGLRTHHDTFVIANHAGGSGVDADREHLAEYETFDLIEADSGLSLLRTWTGYYVCPDHGGGGDVHAADLGPDCYLRAIDLSGGKRAFETKTGHYLSAESDGDFVADSTAIGPWEEFSLVPKPVKTGGQRWDRDAYATSIAFGDVDGDGRDEIGITRRTEDGSRYIILDDATQDFATLHEGGMSWGSAYYATSIAFGDVDGDGRDEVGITRYTRSNSRYMILDDADGGSDADGDAGQAFATLHQGGGHWGSDNYATAIAFGDIDGDGRDEVGVTRYATRNGRYFVFDDAQHGFAKIGDGGGHWGGDNYATSIAFGDVDGDGRDELGVTWRAANNGRYSIFDDAQHGFAELGDGGGHWGSDNYATSIAFGDVDGDGRDEVGVTRKASNNARYYVLDDVGQDFARLADGGDGWGGENYATAIAFGDIDGDGREEIAITRRSDTNARYWILDDSQGEFAILRSSGDHWDRDGYGTSIAMGNIDDDPEAEIGLSRRAETAWRYALYDYFTR